jgi:hypothetical protein
MEESELIKILLNDSIEADKRINSIKEEQKEKRKDRMNDIIKVLDTSQDFYSFNNVVYFSTAAGRVFLDVSKVQHINLSSTVLEAKVPSSVDVVYGTDNFIKFSIEFNNFTDANNFIKLVQKTKLRINII